MDIGIPIDSRFNPAGHVSAVYQKDQWEMSPEQLGLFNADLQNIACQYGAEPIRYLLGKHQYAILALGRNVMASAKQPYGGANALGAEITMRLLRPIDLAFTAGYLWDRDLSGETPGTLFIWQAQAGAADTIGEEEGNIILGFIDPVPLPGVDAYQVITNGNRTYPFYTLSFTQFRADSIPVAECMAPIMEWPEDTVQINCDPSRAINPDRLQAIGIHFARARAMVTTTGSA